MTRLVVFEGPDASGKTVQTSAVARVLRAQGIDADWWNHPTPTVCDARTPWSLALYYAAARARLAGSIAANQGRAVLIVDRWHYSATAALRGADKPYDAFLAELAIAEACALPRPALTIVLTAPGDLLDVRLARRGELRPRDATGVRTAYEVMARGMGWPVVQTDRPRDVVTHELVAMVLARLDLAPTHAQVPPAVCPAPTEGP